MRLSQNCLLMPWYVTQRQHTKNVSAKAMSVDAIILDMSGEKSKTEENLNDIAWHPKCHNHLEKRNNNGTMQIIKEVKLEKRNNNGTMQNVLVRIMLGKHGETQNNAQQNNLDTGDRCESEAY